MKSKIQSILWSALLASGVMLATTVRAQDEEGAKKPNKEQRQGPRGDRLEMLKERLGLTDDQVAKLTPIFAAEREELQAVRKELGKDADRAVVREKVQAVHAKYKPQIAAILTEEQKAKMEQIRERAPRGEKGPKGPGAPDGAGAPPPPPAE